MIFFMLMTIIITITSPPSTAHHSSSRRTHRWNPFCPPEASSSWQSRLKSHNNKTLMLTIANIFDYLAGKGHNRYAIMWKIYIWVYTKMDMVKLKGYWWVSFWCFVTSRCGMFAIPQNIHHREWQWCFKVSKCQSCACSQQHFLDLSAGYNSLPPRTLHKVLLYNSLLPCSAFYCHLVTPIIGSQWNYNSSGPSRSTIGHNYWHRLVM